MGGGGAVLGDGWWGQAVGCLSGKANSGGGLPAGSGHHVLDAPCITFMLSSRCCQLLLVGRSACVRSVRCLWGEESRAGVEGAARLFNKVHERVCSVSQPLSYCLSAHSCPTPSTPRLVPLPPDLPRLKAHSLPAHPRAHRHRIRRHAGRRGWGRWAREAGRQAGNWTSERVGAGNTLHSAAQGSAALCCDATHEGRSPGPALSLPLASPAPESGGVKRNALPCGQAHPAFDTTPVVPPPRPLPLHPAPGSSWMT